ncbi:MAG TPA: thioredoxin domain-containing protein [Bryobacteraceae bacterium]|nr:thioredoxin domain-containing protein [Bryobacteraceae bacterium]
MKLVAAALLVLSPCIAATPEVDKGKTLGSPTAPVRIEIFSDFTCPHCRVLHEETLPLLMKDYVVEGKLYVIDRAFPLTGPGHQYSREAFGYATAAARIGKYQQVADALYANQGTWAIGGNVWGCVSAVLSPAEQKKVQALAKDPGVLAEIQNEYEEGVAAGINETPTMILTAGSKRYPLPRAPNYMFLKSMIDGFLPK